MKDRVVEMFTACKLFDGRGERNTSQQGRRLFEQAETKRMSMLKLLVPILLSQGRDKDCAACRAC